MIMASNVKPIPEDMHTVTPHLVCRGAAEAIEYYKKAFGAVESMRLPAPDGKLMHAQIRIGDSAIMLVDENPAWGIVGPKDLPNSPVTLHLYVKDVDTVYKTAIAAGGTVKMEPMDMFWGDRYGVMIDPFGHCWSLATHTRDMTPEQMDEEMKKMEPGCPGNPNQ
jgi:PhnB protein